MRQASLWQRISSPKSSGTTLPALFIFPHAGASRVSFASLARRLHGFCDVYVTEYPETSILEIAQQLACDFAQQKNGNTFFFGHSMGALVAYETLLCLRAGISPKSLFVSAVEAPHEPHGPASFRSHKGEWDEAILLDFLQSYGGIPAIFSDENVRTFFLTLLAKDLHLLKKYTCNRDLLHLPIYGFWGEDDPVVTKQTMLNWAQYTDQSFSLTSIPGGHLYPIEQSEQLSVRLKALMSTL